MSTAATENKQLERCVQEINLYSGAQPRIRQQGVNAAVYSISMLSVTFILLLTHIVLQQYKQSAEQDLQNQNQLLNNKVETLNTVLKENEALGLDPNLLQRTSELKQKKLVNQQVLASIDAHDQSNNKRGYSEFLIGFSKKTPRGLWITQFSINGTGENIEVHGSATQANLVPRFLSNLSSESVFNGLKFEFFDIEVEDESKKSILFDLKSERM